MREETDSQHLCARGDEKSPRAGSGRFPDSNRPEAARAWITCGKRTVSGPNPSGSRTYFSVRR